MNTGKKLMSALLFFLGAGVCNADPGEEAPELRESKMVIALQSDDVELQELDISHLQPGDVETIVTDSGKRIDILRTESDAEIYIDGQLLGLDDLHKNAPGARQLHMVHENVEIICDSDTDCDHAAWVGSDEVAPEDAEALHEVKKVYIIHKDGETG